MGLLEEFKQRSRAKFRVTEGECVPEQLDFLHAFLREHSEIQRIVEVGFNGGLSAAAFLSLRPDIQLISFDLGRWGYVPTAKGVIDELFPGRHQLVIGDSMRTLPAFLADPAHCHAYDLVFVDGGHEPPVPASDLDCAHRLLKPGGWVIVDDYCHWYGRRGVMPAWDAAIKEGQFRQVGPVHAIHDRGWVCGQPC